MPHPYRLADEADLLTPALVFYPELIRKNIARVVELAGSPDRLPRGPRRRPAPHRHRSRRRRAVTVRAGGETPRADAGGPARLRRPQPPGGPGRPRGGGAGRAGPGAGAAGRAGAPRAAGAAG